MAMSIFKNEGLLGLYAGVTPAVARHIPYTGFRAIGYEYIRAFFCGSAPKEEAPLLAKMAAGMSAGAIGQAIAVPCDLIKVRMQNDGRLVASGKLEAPRYTGLADAFTKIKAQEGIGGFYAGCTPAIQRAALVNLGELTTCGMHSTPLPPPRPSAMTAAAAPAGPPPLPPTPPSRGYPDRVLWVSPTPVATS